MGKWSQIELDKLKNLYSEAKTVGEIAEILQRSPGSIRNKAWRLGITNTNEFTEEEKKFILENYKSHNLKELSDKLGREKTSICRLAKQLGIERTCKKKETTKGFVDESGVWHKNGWTREKPEQKSARISKRFKEWNSKNEHPKGMLGKHHSPEFSAKTSIRVKKYWDEITPEMADKRYRKMIQTKIENGTLNTTKSKIARYSRGIAGEREDLGNVLFRSSWEANIARYMNFLKIRWEYEKYEFVFDEFTKGCISYTPDFYLPEFDIWIEVKGWMNEKSIKKLESFKKYYPSEYGKLILIDKKKYLEIEKWKEPIRNWECA